MQILLTTLNSKYIHLNLAIRLLYELNKKHEGLDWKEFTIKEPQDEVAAHCAQYEIVCFSCYIWNITQTLEVAAKIKKLNPNTKILLGGPEVSYEWQEVIALPQVDFIIIGEGEIPFRDFVNAYPNVSDVAGLVRKLGDGFHYTPSNETFNLEEFKDVNPYINEPPENLYNKVLYIETSRGCPYKCEFCLASLDNKVRYLPIDTIKQNLLYLMQHGKVIKFLDRTFNIKKDFTIDIFKFILENHRPENVFQFEITADIVHPDIIQYIQEHIPQGLLRFEIGIQTVNQKANLEVSRKQNFDKTKSIIEQLSNKIEMHLDLIVGLPLDYFEDVKYSIEEVFKLYAPELQLGFLKFLKGTPMRDKLDQHEYTYDPLPPYQIIESKYLSKDELEQIVILENILEIYWNKKRTIYTFKYISEHYSIFDFMLKFGKYFAARKNFHRYTLNDIYELLDSYIYEQFKGDKYLKQILAIDYYLQHKIKPKSLIHGEVKKEEKLRLIAAHNLNHHKYRHVILPIHFDFDHFDKTNEIVDKESVVMIEYNGVNRPYVVG